jgi:choline dehydrogenase
MRPLSRGEIKLTGKDVLDKIDIRLNYLSENQDLETLIDGVELLREVFSQKPFDRYRGEEITPGFEIKNRLSLADWVRNTASTVHHLAGSCRMGADNNSVTDPKLCVRGIVGLRVVDASIFPSIPSANTAAPTIMVAEKAASLINS